ncbi:unnamed protein product [Caenorhabditis nigoni]
MPVVSYPVLCCILEHIEADCRLVLSARSPKISKFEKRIPLRVRRITFKKNAVSIDGTEYKIALNDQKMEVSQNDETRSHQPLTLRIYKYIIGSTVEKKFPKPYEVEEATRKVVEYLLGGRNEIFVKYLEVYRNGYQNIRYLFGISNMKVSSLFNEEIGLPEFHPLIETPLKELHFKASHPTDFEKTIARKAEIIFIYNSGYTEPDNWSLTHRNLPNKEVQICIVDDGIANNSIMELIDYWKETRKTVGSRFSLPKPYGDVERFVEKVRKRFQETYVKLKEPDESTSFDINAVSIKIDSESEIVVYPIFFGWTGPAVGIKVVTIGSSVEISEPLKKANIIPRQSSNYSALVVIPLLVLLVALCLQVFF